MNLVASVRMSVGAAGRPPRRAGGGMAGRGAARWRHGALRYVYGYERPRVSPARAARAARQPRHMRSFTRAACQGCHVAAVASHAAAVTLYVTLHVTLHMMIYIIITLLLL